MVKAMADTKEQALFWIFVGKWGFRKNSVVHKELPISTQKLIDEGFLFLNPDTEWIEPTPACILAYAKGKEMQ